MPIYYLHDYSSLRRKEGEVEKMGEQRGERKKARGRQLEEKGEMGEEKERRLKRKRGREKRLGEKGE